MGSARTGILALGAGLAAAVVVGCGSGGSLLSGAQAAQLNSQLNGVSQALRDGDCTTAENDISTLQSELQSYNGVNSTLLENLNQGVNTIEQLTQTKCSATTTSTKTTRSNTSTRTSTVTTSTNTKTSPTTTTNTNTQSTTTSTTGGQGLPTVTLTSTTGGAGPTTTSSSTTTTSPTTTTTTTATTPSSTSTSPAGGATGL